jgi:hypothetical protein
VWNVRGRLGSGALRLRPACAQQPDLEACEDEVGERDGEGKAGEVVRHRITPAREAPADKYGGKALLVHHDEILPDDWSCEEGACP